MLEHLEALRGTRFGCIMADPAWNFRSYVPGQNPQSSRAAERHYRTMSLDEIRALPVANLADRDCHLFLWSTAPFLPHAIDLMGRWGFRFSTVAFYWAKMRRALDGRQLRFIPAADGDFHLGMGFTTRKNVEICLLGRRGRAKRINRDVRELIVAPVREHSRKPDETYQRIERYCAGPYLELFARTERPGWTSVGDEVGKFKFKTNGRVQDAEGRRQHEDCEGAATDRAGAERVSLP